MEVLERGDAKLGDILVRINCGHGGIDPGDIVKVVAIQDISNIKVSKVDGFICNGYCVPEGFRYATDEEKRVFGIEPENVSNYEIY